jgi:holo-ACP synthase CitX
MNAVGQGEYQTLADILRARDERLDLQNRLLAQYQNTLISYKLNIPGSVKYNALIRRVFDEGLAAITAKLAEHAMPLLFAQQLYKNSGPEFLGAVAADACAVKEFTLAIEETHPLGRLYDIDVIGQDGQKCDRSDMQKDERRCLLCDQPAFVCGRARAHSVEEMLNKIQSMCDAYFTAKEA